jgi:hypothetical protein
MHLHFQTALAWSKGARRLQSFWFLALRVLLSQLFLSVEPAKGLMGAAAVRMSSACHMADRAHSAEIGQSGFNAELRRCGSW